MNSSVFVYISGPMTAKDGRTIEQNTADGVAVYLNLLCRGIPAFSPHLSGGFPSAWTALSHAEWIAYDCAILDRCTHILMMPRFQTSAGAIQEREYWIELERGSRIAYSVAELCEMVAAIPEART
jgi:Domain of unknown function (DUF4406)